MWLPLRNREKLNSFERVLEKEQDNFLFSNVSSSNCTVPKGALFYDLQNVRYTTVDFSYLSLTYVHFFLIPFATTIINKRCLFSILFCLFFFLFFFEVPFTFAPTAFQLCSI